MKEDKKTTEILIKVLNLAIAILILVVIVLVYKNNKKLEEEFNLKIEQYNDSLKIERINVAFRDSVLIVLDTRLHETDARIDSLKRIKGKIVYKYLKQRDEILNDSDSNTVAWFNTVFPK